MNLQPTPTQVEYPLAVLRPHLRLNAKIRRWLLLLATAYFTLLFAGGSTVPAQQAIFQKLALTVAGHNFALLPWEIAALTAKTKALFEQPASQLNAAESVETVRAYMARADAINALEGQLTQTLNANQAEFAAEIERLEAQLITLRSQQAQARPAVEQIIEWQVGTVLAERNLSVAGYSLPPVQFAFVDPPRKLVVSPRDRIETLYGQMLDATMSQATIEQAEQQILQQQNLSAYITGIGGLGAYPTMVIDNAPLPWILSTVAHEWAHNYLTFFPLGFRYGVTSENIIINETVAEVVGNEIGAEVLRRYYPALVPQPTAEAKLEPGESETPSFDFATEMRKTRLQVDVLLAEGHIEAAEQYMEQRRQEFVQNGYPLRVLNQAYFAFHGSYGTTAASTSPIGPKLEQLRQSTPDLLTFLQVVRGFATEQDIDTALEAWQQK